MAEGDIFITNPDLEHNACVAALQSKGWDVKFRRWAWRAVKGNVYILAWSPLELLGGVALYEARGDKWRTQDSEKKLVEGMIVSEVERPIVRRQKVKVCRPLPWMCPDCHKHTANRMEAVEREGYNKLQLQVICPLGHVTYCGDAEGDFEVLAHDKDYYIMRYVGPGHEHDPLLDEDVRAPK